MMTSAVIIGKGMHWSFPDRVIRWDDYPSNETEISLPKCVEQEGDLLKKEYLAWVHKLSLSQIHEKPLYEYLTISEGISAWWSGVFVEKSFYKMPEIYDVLRLLALERYCKKTGIKHLILHVQHRGLHEVLKTWCKQRGMTYQWKFINLPIWQFPITLLKMFLYLIRYLWQHRVFLACKIPDGNTGLLANGVTLFSYFDNLDKKTVQAGCFGSLYWDGLPILLNQERWTINWVFRFMPSIISPNPKTALLLQQRFTKKDSFKNRFFFLEQWLSWSIVIKAIFIYWEICRKKPTERFIKHLFQFHDSQLNFWPLLKNVWRRDMYGVGAMENAIEISLFSDFARRIPKQAMGICLAEYQGWERILLQFWRKNGHKRLRGFAHSTIRFFDLRYFEEKTAYDGVFPPRYDSLLVGGEFAFNLLKEAGFPPVELLPVEALRYLHVNTSIKRQKVKDISHLSRINLLVVTDYDKNNCIEQLALLGSAMKLYAASIPIFLIIKPHPNLDVKTIAPHYLPQKSYKISHTPLSEILHTVDIAYTSNFTSASLDAVLSQVPIVIALSGAQINMSPLRGIPGVIFVTSPLELITAIYHPIQPRLSENYFYLHSDLRLWCALLKR